MEDRATCNDYIDGHRRLSEYKISAVTRVQLWALVEQPKVNNTERSIKEFKFMFRDYWSSDL